LTRAFDRDDDGYLDMDRFPDAEPDGAVGVVFEPPPPLPDSDWLAALAHAVNAPDAAAATDDLLDVGGLDEAGADGGADGLDPSALSLDGVDSGSHVTSDWSAHDWSGSDDGADGAAQADGGADDADSSTDPW
jgi:hypothetical protein